MENASKALLMAAGVLLGLMIISLAVLLFTNFGGTSSQIHDNIEQNQISQFNSQFTQYIGKNNVTIYDVISMANLATENNKYYEFSRTANMPTGNDNYITVILDGTRIEYGTEETNENITSEYNSIIANRVSQISESNINLPTYDVQVQISDVTRRVFVVTCIQN